MIAAPSEMNQATLFKTDTSRFDAFLVFYRENPHVWRLFVRFAERARSQGKKCSARLIIERLRWDLLLETNTDDEFRINDHHNPYFARLLAQRDSRFKDFFTFKPKKYDCTDAELLAACNEIDKETT